MSIVVSSSTPKHERVEVTRPSPARKFGVLCGVAVLLGTIAPAPACYLLAVGNSLLEEPESSVKTPNPAKAPWYFLGVQDALVYYDPWLAGMLPFWTALGVTGGVGLIGGSVIFTSASASSASRLRLRHYALAVLLLLAWALLPFAISRARFTLRTRTTPRLLFMKPEEFGESLNSYAEIRSDRQATT